MINIQIEKDEKSSSYVANISNSKGLLLQQVAHPRIDVLTKQISRYVIPTIKNNEGK